MVFGRNASAFQEGTAELRAVLGGSVNQTLVKAAGDKGFKVNM